MAAVAPLPIAAGWVVVSRSAELAGFPTTAAFVVFGLMLIVATITDLRWRRIYNWTTYTAIYWAVVLQILAAVTADASVLPPPLPPVPVAEVLGCIPPRDALAGFALGFGLMFLLYSTLGGGGGDLKLVTAAGCYLGPETLLEGLIDSYILAGVAVAVYLVWVVGPVGLLASAANRLPFHMSAWFGFLGPPPDVRGQLQRGLPMAPFYSAGFLAAIWFRL